MRSPEKILEKAKELQSQTPGLSLDCAILLWHLQHPPRHICTPGSAARAMRQQIVNEFLQLLVEVQQNENLQP